MTFRMAMGGIWREFEDVCRAVDFAFGRCAGCFMECHGVFCRKCYRGLSPKLKRALRTKRAGRLIGYEQE